MSGLRRGFCGGTEMPDKRRLNLSFSMTSNRQRQAWKRISAIPPGRRTDFVCQAVLGGETAALLDAVRDTIRAELHGVTVKKEEKQQAEAGEIREDILGFLRALQEDGGDET